MRRKTILLLLFLSVMNGVTPQDSGPLYPVAGTASTKSDDGSSPKIQLTHPFVYFGQSYSQIYVNQNGHLTFEDAWSDYTPKRFPLHGTRDIIAPFWADLDNRNNGLIYYAQYTSGHLIQQVTQDINAYFPGLHFNARLIFIATWHEVAYYPTSGTQTTVQAVLTTDGRSSFVLMNYGYLAPTSKVIQAGYDTVRSSHYYTIPGSFSSNASGSDSVFSLNSNVNVPGRWAFRVDDGSGGCTFKGHYRQGGEQFSNGEDCQSLCTCNGTTGTVQCFPSSCGPQESCRVVEGEFGCHTNPHGTCSASGDPHYLSFDGKAFDFQGTCRYVLATVCNETDKLHQFSVEAKNEPLNGLAVSTTAEVFVQVLNYQVHMSRDNRGLVKVNGMTRNLPVVLNQNVSVYATGYQTFVRTDFGLKVMYNGHSSVSITVPPDYRGRTCGLCGNFNGNPNDDFHTPSGTTVTSPDVFGTAWKVPGNYSCSDGCGSSCPRCNNDQPARTQCALIQAADGPFSFCHEVVDPATYFSDCVFDVCVSGNRGNDLLCRALETYVSACQSANVQIYPWRQNTTCRSDCPANSHYELCGTDCGHTCSNNTDATCEQACSEGCFCDQGFVRSGARCVPASSCGCQHDGFYYNAGESFWSDSCSQLCECRGPNDLRCTSASCTPTQECTIRNGQLGCYDAMSTCTVWGDPHYITFDGALAHFQGTCSYIITEGGSRNNETRFSVVATNNHRGNNLVSFVSSVDINLSKQSESVQVRIGPNIRVKVNGAEVSLPTTAGTLGQLTRQGSYIVFDAVDFKVQFDGRSTLLVRIGQHFQNRVTGMCGNFNGDSSDDKVLPTGALAQNDNQFGNSWKSSTSQEGCGSTDERPRDCHFTQEYTELCRVITNTSGPFSSCHLHSDPQPFFTSCVYDLCYDTRVHDMLCSAVSSYDKTCSVLGLKIPNWRSALHCDESDPCEQLDCTEHEWCEKKDGVYGCCDEHHCRMKDERNSAGGQRKNASSWLTQIFLLIVTLLIANILVQ